MLVKKILRCSFILFLLLTFFLAKVEYVYSETEFPGLTCGVVGAGEDAGKCCYLEGSEDESVSAEAKEKINRINRTESFACPAGGRPSTSNAADPNCKCIQSEGAVESKPLETICSKLRFDSSSERGLCLSCARDGGTWTSFGCVPSTLQGFIGGFLLRTLLGLAGMFALLCIIYSSFLLQTSRGNPEKIKKGREYLTNCILGLLLILFSVFILRLIGVNILNIPGFG